MKQEIDDRLFFARNLSGLFFRLGGQNKFLSPADLKVLAALLDLHYAGLPSCSILLLSKLTQLSRTTVFRHLLRLESRGLVTHVPGASSTFRALCSFEDRGESNVVPDL